MMYSEWILKNWSITGGLITQTQAGKILQRSKTRIKQMIQEKKLTPFIYENEPALVSFCETMKFLDESVKKKEKTKAPQPITKQ